MTKKILLLVNNMHLINFLDFSFTNIIIIMNNIIIILKEIPPVTHLSSVQAACDGLFSLSPLSSICTTSLGSIPGYGVLPKLNTSQQRTP